MKTEQPHLTSTDLDILFKSGMRRLASGVSLIATEHEGVPHGLAVTSVTSVSMDPPTLLVCINHAASAYQAVELSGRFSVNVLPAEDAELAEIFADSKRRGERFGRKMWKRTSGEPPVLESALVTFVCSVAERMSYNSHAIFFGRVDQVLVNGVNDDNPLIYFERAFRSLGSKTQH